jgi:hypothetical protein
VRETLHTSCDLLILVEGCSYYCQQAELFAGAQAAIAWRSQVLDLHDRGLAPEQIRYIMHLEEGGAGYEGWNGRIDDIVGNVPRSLTTMLMMLQSIFRCVQSCLRGGMTVKPVCTGNSS